MECAWLWNASKGSVQRAFLVGRGVLSSAWPCVCADGTLPLWSIPLHLRFDVMAVVVNPLIGIAVMLFAMVRPASVAAASRCTLDTCPGRSTLP